MKKPLLRLFLVVVVCLVGHTGTRAITAATNTSPLPGSQLGNISTRCFVQTGDNLMIGGFIVQGTQPKRVIIRAIGPELGAPPYNIPNVLPNPTLELHDGTGALIASNDNWQHTIIGGIITASQVSDIINSSYAPGDGRESAIIAELSAGNYTAIVSGVDNRTGVALVEVYDLSSSATSILGNISTRSFVQTGDNVMIGGFIVNGTQPKKVIVRAIGPELGEPPFNIPNALANPTLELHNGTGALIASNDNWQTTIIGGIITANQVRDIINSGLAPGDGRESAIIATLPPGNYTAIVRGVNSISGVGLVEVYDLNPALLADTGSSYSNSKVPYSIDRHAILAAIGHPNAYAIAVGYGDFNGDGIADVAFALISGTPTGSPIIIALGQPGGSYIDGTTQVISGQVPAPIHPRKIIVADFNGDGRPDIFIADHGYDQPPFPGNHNWLLLSNAAGHLVYQSAFAATEPVGFHHGATAGPIDRTGHLDIFVTGNLDLGSSPYFLLNDGHGHFAVDTTRVPTSLMRTQLYTCELIDIDRDGNLDLVVGGHEYGGMPTEIFWGNGTGFYSDANKTVLPADAHFDIVVDIDSEDINHDGLRDLLITRTAHLPQFYTGFYFQVVMQTSRHVFADQSLPRVIHNRSTWMGNTGVWVDWMHLVDMTGDSVPDIVVDDAALHLGWRNDGNGFFTFTGGW